MEHPLPQALGGRGWSTREVCRGCNRRAGSEVDQPFAAQVLVRAHRHFHGVPDARGVVPRAARLTGTTTDGVPMVATFTADGEVVGRRLPTALRRDEDGERFVVEPGEGEEFLRLRTERLRRRLGPGYGVQGTIETVPQDVEGSMEFTIDGSLWPRLGAKLALAFGREALGVEWLDQPVAELLRLVLWEPEKVPGDVLLPWHSVVAADDQLRPLLHPPEHLIAVQRTYAGRRVLMVHLFGEWRYGVPLGDFELSEREPAWVFDPVRGTCRTTEWTMLIEEAVTALADGRLDSTARAI